jgi:DNA-binding Lrp family transcriptional regulator
VAVTDPVDARLLAALAEFGKMAVHELAAKVGMDPREVAYRLVALSGSGLPLLVGVECDPNGLRAAIGGPWPNRPPASPQGALQGAPPGTSPHPVQGTLSGVYNVQGTPSGRYSPPPAQAPKVRPLQRPPAPPNQQFAPPTAPPAADPVMSTWGPPQSSSWARGDKKPPRRQSTGKHGRTGDVMETQGLEGEQLAVQLLEVQDPADFLFKAAGYRLDEGERAVVVHTEITNRGGIPFVSLPDNYLELITTDDKAIGKAPVSLTSRPPHKIGVQPGETLGGHTVYVLPDATRVVSVRWSPRPEPDERTLVWSIDG